MTHTDTPESQSQTVRIQSVGAIDWPQNAIVIADGGLPDSILESLPNPLLVQAGESLKSLTAIEALAHQVLVRQSSRPMTIIAVGGGSVGDAVGFLASVLWRGVDLWHVPTTLVAMVDSAHGGKTAVNLGRAKNQLGTFYPAHRVYICEDVLATLPIAQRRQGFVELIKGLWLGEPAIVSALDPSQLERIVSAPFDEIRDLLFPLLDAAIGVKHDIVARDPHEKLGIRTFLNFGHTMAHALELHCGLDHGSAVAWGMATAAHLSVKHGRMREDEAHRLYQHVYPLMRHIHSVELPSDDQITEALTRDKKRVDNKLRSVVLDAAGQPRVMEIPPEEWVRAFRLTYERWHRDPVNLRFERPNPEFAPVVSASKSELNRALVMSHLSCGKIHVHGQSRAADVVHMQRAIEQIDHDIVYVGEGGTTFRFLAAVAATRPQTTFQLAPKLYQRPHQALFDALLTAGCGISLDPERCRVTVTGWPTPPTVISVDPSHSSQHVSALAMLAVAGIHFELRLTAEVVSRGYLDLTLAMLQECGVSVQEEDGVLRLDGRRLQEHVLTPALDDSSLAVWRVLHWRGIPVKLPANPSQQPDGGLGSRLAAGTREFDVSDMPDVVPVLAAGCALRQGVSHIEGGTTLKNKESDRIEDLARMLRSNGVKVDTGATSLTITGGELMPDVADPAHDHRLAFAALILSAAGPLTLLNPWVVAKSYPEFFDDARQAGWSILPIALKGA